MGTKWYEVTVKKTETYLVEVDDDKGLSAQDFISDELSGDDSVDEIIASNVQQEQVEMSKKTVDGDKIYPLN